MIEFEGETLYSIAAGIGFIAYLMTNVFWLRILLIAGACMYIATGLLLNLNSMIGWHVAYALINLVQVVLILMGNRICVLHESILVLYGEKFSTLKPREFKKLINMNDKGIVGPCTLLGENRKNDNLFLITDGEAVIKKQGRVISRLGVGDFIGEMSVLTGKPASTDVIVEDCLEFRFWTRQDLDRLEKRNISIYNRFMMAVGRNLVEKLHVTTAKSAQANLSSSWKHEGGARMAIAAPITP
ncbi:MAG: Crp/Fnr family transcriptional regulator [bacterium]